MTSISWPMLTLGQSFALCEQTWPSGWGNSATCRNSLYNYAEQPPPQTVPSQADSPLIHMPTYQGLTQVGNGD